MRFCSLQSGSNGNCLYLASDETQILIDAGISGRQAELRLAGHGLEIRDVDAVLISHDHSDHTRSMGIFQRKFELDVWATDKTLRAAQRRNQLGRMDRVRTFSAGKSLQIGDLTIQSIPTPHDAADGAAFIVDDGSTRVGIFTDLGHVFLGLDEAIRSCSAVLVESNYDPDMLAGGPYPAFLKRRISGPAGHLSNIEAAQLLASAGRNLAWACIGHLSAENNCPSKALTVHRHFCGAEAQLHVADRYTAGTLLTV
ncbi:MAG: MBL fold metallo-hydrolase [Phycisphaerae bacterium]